MKDFFKMMLASCLSNLIILGIGVFVFVALIVGSVATMVSSGENADMLVVKENSVLELDLNKSIYERTPNELDAYLEGNQVLGADVLLKSIRMAKDDDNISGIYLKISALYNAGWALTEEIRNAIVDFKESGKFVYSYADTYSQKGYYLASVADSVFINPSGMLDFKGIAAETLFIKDLLDKLNVKVKLIRPRSNAFKSAGEMYTMTQMSQANKTQVRTYIESIWNHVVADMSAVRGISVDRLNAIADNLEAYLPADALKNGLVDGLVFEHDVLVLLSEQMGLEDYDDINFVKAKKYTQSSIDVSSNKIAVIYAQGDVVQGKGTGVNVYSSVIAKALDDAADNDAVKAIVLRVNSPGGAVVASEIMTNAVIRAKQKKPIVVSMSDVAASAGYEISCNAHKIVAMPTTITGSIGVFGLYPELGGMLKNKFGVTTDTVLTNKNAAALSTMRPLSGEGYDVLVRNVEDFYVTFCQRVALGRNLPVEYVDSIARGRVWTGIDAKKLGLVDELGGMDKALDIAAELAEIDSYSILAYPKEKDFATQLMEILGEEQSLTDVLSKKTDVEKYYEMLEQINNMEPLQARLPYFINF